MEESKKVKDIQYNEFFIDKSTYKTKNHTYTIIKGTNLGIDRMQHLEGYYNQVRRALEAKDIATYNAELKKLINENKTFDLSIAIHKQDAVSYTHLTLPTICSV